MTDPSEDSPENIGLQLSVGLMETYAMLTPMLEAAEGQRKQIEARGWSPEWAERISGTILMGLIGTMFTQQQKGSG